MRISFEKNKQLFIEKLKAQLYDWSVDQSEAEGFVATLLKEENLNDDNICDYIRDNLIKWGVSDDDATEFLITFIAILCGGKEIYSHKDTGKKIPPDIPSHYI